MYYSRRRALKMLGFVALTSVAGQLLSLPRLNAAQSLTSVTGLNDFMLVSRMLTQQEALNDTIGHMLLMALSQTNKDFFSRLTQLKSLLQNHPELLEQNYLTFATDSDSETLAKMILSGWYTGVVGEGYQALIITYVNTLSNLLVDEKLVPPSFSFGVCGSWAQRP